MEKSDDDPQQMKSLNEKLLITNNQQNVKKKIKMVPPDGGWGWFIVLGGFLNAFLGSLSIFAFSILFSPLLMSSGATSTKIAWIFNMHGLIWSINIFFTGPLCDEFGWRKVAIFGGITNFAALFLSAFSPTPDFLFFSYSLLGGIGGSSGFSVNFYVVSRYFEKHLGFALGITTTGSCVSAFLAPIASNYLLENYGYMGGTLIFAALLLNQCVGGALYHPVEWHMIPKEIDPTSSDILNKEILSVSQNSKEETHLDLKSIDTIQDACKISSDSDNSVDVGYETTIHNSSLSAKSNESKSRKNEDKSQNSKRGSKFINVFKTTFDHVKSLKYTRVQLIALGYCGFTVCCANIQLWTPFVITNAGYSLEIAAWFSSLSAIGNIAGRMVMSVFSDRKFFNVRYGFMSGILLIGISIIVFPLIKDIKFYIISICCLGIGTGFAVSLHVTVMVNVMGAEMLPAVMGVSSLFKAVGQISIGTLTGVVSDATSSYTYAMWMLGAIALAAFCCFLLIPCAEKLDKKKYGNEGKIQEFQKC